MSILTARWVARERRPLLWVVRRRGRNTLITCLFLLSRAPGETLNTNQVPPAALKAWHNPLGSGAARRAGRVGHFFPPGRSAGRSVGSLGSSCLLRALRRVVGGTHDGSLCHRMNRRGSSLGALAVQVETNTRPDFPDKLVFLNPRLGLAQDWMWASSYFLWSADASDSRREGEPRGIVKGVSET